MAKAKRGIAACVFALALGCGIPMFQRAPLRAVEGVRSRTPGANAAEPARAEAPNTTASSIGVDDVSRADDPSAPTVEPEDEDSIGGSNAPVFCEQCNMWSNGPTQWWDHVIGKKHQRSVHRAHRTTRATPMPAGWGAAEPEEEPDDLVVH